MLLLVLFIFRHIEGQVVEISQLQEIFSEKVLHQVRKKPIWQVIASRGIAELHIEQKSAMLAGINS